MQEAEAFKDLFVHRENLFQSYIKADKSLQEKKEKLFKAKDLSKWGGFKDQAELLRLRDELLRD